jgi:hypothetical protein
MGPGALHDFWPRNGAREKAREIFHKARGTRRPEESIPGSFRQFQGCGRQSCRLHHKVYLWELRASESAANKRKRFSVTIDDSSGDGSRARHLSIVLPQPRRSPAFDQRGPSRGRESSSRPRNTGIYRLHGRQRPRSEERIFQGVCRRPASLFVALLQHHAFSLSDIDGGFRRAQPPRGNVRCA